MPRKATGNVYFSAGKWYARVRLSAKERPNFALPTCTTEEQAVARLAILAELAAKLRAAERVTFDVARGLLERAAQRDGKALEAVRSAVDALCRGEARPRLPDGPTAGVTFQQLAGMWTSGELARLYPDHVKVKKSVDDDVYRLDLHILPIVGDTPIASFTLDDALAVMRAIPPRSAATRRHVAQLMHRLLAIAVFPARLITANPLPKGFLPKVGPGKAKGWLYPDEDAALLSCPAIALCWRVYYGVLNREGPRASEAAATNWSDLDLERGTITLDENKTDDPRAWALSPGVVRALRAWRKLRGAAARDDSSPVFINDNGDRIGEAHLADRFREHLQAAGVKRPELFARTDARQRIRLHDTRSTFVTISLANGRSETWVQDRTGHKSSAMINRYRRAARTAAELGLGDLAPLDEAIPELGGSPAGAKGGTGGDRASSPAPRRRPAARKPLENKASTEGGTRTHKPLRTADFESDATDATGSDALDHAGDLQGGRDGSTPIERSSARCGSPSAHSQELEASAMDDVATPPTMPSPRVLGERATHAPAVVGVAIVAPAPLVTSPRAVLLEQLGEGLRHAVAAGDLEAARIAHAAIGQLIGSPVESIESSGVVPVLELARERERRGGR